jgi:hypothetical protein
MNSELKPVQRLPLHAVFRTSRWELWEEIIFREEYKSGILVLHLRETVAPFKVRRAGYYAEPSLLVELLTPHDHPVVFARL